MVSGIWIDVVEDANLFNDKSLRISIGLATFISEHFLASGCKRNREYVYMQCYILILNLRCMLFLLSKIYIECYWKTWISDHVNWDKKDFFLKICNMGNAH